MGYTKKDEILLHEELCGRHYEETELIKATKRFRENLNLVYHVCKKFSEPRDPSLSKEDLIQSGYLGLWTSCLHFDESKGLEFATYAVPTIRGCVLRTLRDSNALKLPRRFVDIRGSLLAHGFTLPLTDEEIDVLVSEGRFSRKQILEYSEPSLLSVDDHICNTKGDTRPISEIIPDRGSEIRYQFSEEEIESIIDKVLTYIKPSCRDLVEEWMYATLEGYKITQTDLARKYKIRQPHTSRILNSAIDILRMHGEEIRQLFGV